MAKNIINFVDEVEDAVIATETNSQTEVKEVKEREIRCECVRDGVYKYVYCDTGEDVV